MYRRTSNVNMQHAYINSYDSWTGLGRECLVAHYTPVFGKKNLNKVNDNVCLMGHKPARQGGDSVLFTSNISNTKQLQYGILPVGPIYYLCLVRGNMTSNVIVNLNIIVEIELPLSPGKTSGSNIRYRSLNHNGVE